MTRAAGVAATLLLAAGVARPALADEFVLSDAAGAPEFFYLTIEPGRILVRIEASNPFASATLDLPDGGSARTRLRVVADGRAVPLAPLAEGYEIRGRRPAEIVAAPDTSPAARRVYAATFAGRLPDGTRRVTIDDAPGDAPVASGSGRPDHGIGFVAYHRDVPVTGVLYWPSHIAFDLRADDPWYTQVTPGAFSRRARSPVEVFLYVMPYQVRLEALVRLRDALALDCPDEIAACLARRFRDHAPLVIDGTAETARTVTVRRLRRTADELKILADDAPASPDADFLGVVAEYRAGPVPDTVEGRWPLPSIGPDPLPLVMIDPAGRYPVQLGREGDQIRWTNTLVAELWPTAAVTDDGGHDSRRRPLVAVIAAAAGALMFFGLYRLIGGTRFGRPGAAAVSAALAAGAAVAAFAPFAPFVPRETSAVPFQPVLANVYRSFAIEDDEDAYRSLSQSLDGPVLRSAFVESRRTVARATRNGNNLSFSDLEILDARALPRLPWTAARRWQMRWEVAGAVTHWGHVHLRRVRYGGVVTLAPRPARAAEKTGGETGGRYWKITALSATVQDFEDETNLRFPGARPEAAGAPRQGRDQGQD